ncbi:MAG: ribonuclease P protein component [Sphingobacteriales bacterium]|nr:MAG: ribonuclease P protein component [Sphingobacteriales bacterium]
MATFTLNKNERLKSRKQIEQLFKEGKNFVVFPYKVFYVTANDQRSTTNNLQFGIGVSNRNFKKAVDRNRIKRLTREAWRLQKNELKALVNENKITLNVFFIFTGKEIVEYNFAKEKVAVILKKLIKLVDENNTPHT